VLGMEQGAVVGTGLRSVIGTVPVSGDVDGGNGLVVRPPLHGQKSPAPPLGTSSPLDHRKIALNRAHQPLTLFLRSKTIFSHSQKKNIYIYIKIKMTHI